MASQNHAALKQRVADLAANFVDFDIPLDRDPSAHELDLIAAFKLLVHAEFESFIEDRVREGLNTAISEWKATGHVTRALFGLLLRWFPSAQQTPFTAFCPRAEATSLLDALHKKAAGEISDNNSIKKDAFSRLCHSVGIFQDDLPATLLAALESYGKNRGDVAHNAVGKVQTLNDPRVEAGTAHQIVDLLEDFDDMVAASVV